MNQQLLEKILDADISRETKEKIISYWLLPQGTSQAPIQKVNEGRVGSIKRITKEQLDLKKNPKKAEELKAMEDTLDKVVNE